MLAAVIIQTVVKLLTACTTTHQNQVLKAASEDLKTQMVSSLQL